MLFTLLISVFYSILPPIRGYKVNDNFIVRSDSLVVQYEDPMLTRNPQNHVVLHRGQIVAVAKFHTIFHNDILNKIDTTWVQLGTVINDSIQEVCFVWAEEDKILSSTVPDSPLSQILYEVKNWTPTIRIISVVLFISNLCVRFRNKIYRKQNSCHCVFLDNQHMIFPLAFIITISVTAIIYSHILDVWTNYFYFNPTLNPFSAIGGMGSVILLSWISLILFLTSLMTILKISTPTQFITYSISLCTLAFICTHVFSVVIPKPYNSLSLIICIIIALRLYLKTQKILYKCGFCGKNLTHLGKCPNCGKINR